MAIKTIVLIISLLVPGLNKATVKEYATLIEANSCKYDIDPKLYIAVVYSESRFNHTAYANHNYGLGGLRYRWYKKDVNSKEELYDPEINLRLTARSISTWKKFHETQCKEKHHFIGHYGGGNKASRRYERAIRSALWKVSKIMRNNKSVNPTYKMTEEK